MPNEPAAPSPSPDESVPPADAAASSRDSSRASQSEAPGFIADAGPEFDPEDPGALPPPPPVDAADPLEQLAEWEEAAISNVLGVQGRLLHAAVGAAPQEWIYTELDLAAIAPALTRIANRYEPIRRYAKFGDPILVATGLAGYATRSLIERRAALPGAEKDEGGTTVIPPAPAPVPTTDAPPAPPRQAASVPPASPAPGPPPPMQPSTEPPAVPPPRPAEADIDPTQVQWEVGE